MISSDSAIYLICIAQTAYYRLLDWQHSTLVSRLHHSIFRGYRFAYISSSIWHSHLHRLLLSTHFKKRVFHPHGFTFTFHFLLFLQNATHRFISIHTTAYTRSYHFICFFFLFLLSFQISSSIFRDFLLRIFVTIDPTCWGWQLRLASLVALQAACTSGVWWNRVDDNLEESQLGAML